MAGRVFLSPIYLGIRWSIWALLLLLGVLDGCRHRSVRSRGYQLYWLVVGCVGAFLVRDSFLLAFSIESQSGSW